MTQTLTKIDDDNLLIIEETQQTSKMILTKAQICEKIAGLQADLLTWEGYLAKLNE